MTMTMTMEVTRPEVTRPRVLIALSPRTPPHAAIGAGRAIAAAFAAPLHGALVWPTPISPGEVHRLLKIEPEVLEGMVIDVAVGDPAERIGAMVRDQPTACLVVVTDRDGSDTCGFDVACARLLMAVHTGLLVLRSGTELRPIQRILVPLDGRPSTAEALHPVTKLAQATGATIDVLLVDDAARLAPSEPGAMAPPQYVDQPQHEWPAFSEEFVQRFMGGCAHCPGGVKTRFFCGRGEAAEEILRFTELLDPDLVALAWHGSACGEHASVFRRVVRGTTRPVLVLRCPR